MKGFSGSASLGMGLCRCLDEAVAGCQGRRGSEGLHYCSETSTSSEDILGVGGGLPSLSVESFSCAL